MKDYQISKQLVTLAAARREQMIQRKRYQSYLVGVLFGASLYLVCQWL